MKKRMVKLKTLSLVMMLGLLAAGCGSSFQSSKSEEIAYDTASGYAGDDICSAETAEAAAEDGMYDAEGQTAEGVEVQDRSRKLIRNVNLEVETETFGELLLALSDKTKRLGGYIEESYTYNGSSYYGSGSRNANLTIRIPAEKLDDFLSCVSEASNVISQNESVTDVTLQYVDMESHKKALLAEQERLLSLLERAETIEDIISLEGRLSEVRYQIESMESRLRTMDNQVSYSTVYLYINEVARFTPVKEQTIGEKIVSGFKDSLYDVGMGILDLGVGIIINLPYLILWAVIILLAVLIVRFVLKLRRRRRQKTREKKQEMAEKQRVLCSMPSEEQINHKQQEKSEKDRNNQEQNKQQ